MAPANNTSGNAAMMLEEPLIRTPYELLRRSHRSAQRQVEKDFLAVQGALNAIAKSLSGDDAESRAQAVTKLDQATERVKGLKRKLEDIQPNQNNPTPLRSRVSYLDHQSKPPKDAPQGGVSTGTEEAGDKTLDRYIVDYLLRTGHMKTATALATKQDIESLVDIKLFAELTKIERALVEKHSVAEALAWCGENRGTLKKTKNNLEFTLRLQDFIELCKKRETTSAIAYSRKYLSAWAPTHMHEIQQGMTLLAFGERTGVTLYKKLYDQERWQSVRHQFRDTFLSLYALPSQSVLSLALSAGLSTLRLPSCVQHVPQAQPPSPTVPLLPAAPPLHNLEDTLSFINSSSTTRHAASPFSDVGGDMSGLIYVNAQGMTACGADGKMDVDLKTHPDARVGNIDCPTCGEDMKVLASEVPMSHHVNSTLVCRISGQIMDSQNPPLSFPNGYVYSTNALKEMAKTNFDVVVCPRTGDSCAFARLRKVYIS